MPNQNQSGNNNARMGGMGKMQGNRLGSGPEGNCVCPNCGAKSPHQRGVPCFQMKCPNCQSSMTRE